ncbi:phosphatase PAP2 family protein [Sutcliffiella horikoshii]|uniref:phosphatase PAP2 family protein n=1 Tax=Sutcliffiella horikoshii TaxID=79883 RepID=UPI001F3E9076|nr:phosphatase PAP2 family protein [Sutcliffiella horikoshii]MCG1020998.1 phosphatase PAP2 family protein [Sutcliffiella horikoshii]
MFLKIRPEAFFKASIILFLLFLLVAGLTLVEAAVSFDTMLGEKMYRFAEMDRLFIFLSFIGSRLFFYPALIVLSVVLLIKRKWSLVLFTWCNLVGVRLLNTFLKTLFSRERPTLDHIVEAGYYSFPSGHSMNSMAFFGAIAILSLIVARSDWLRITVVMSCIVLIFLIGWSRVYLGVHFPLDVLGGFLMGASWLFLVSAILLKFEHQNRKLFSFHNNG